MMKDAALPVVLIVLGASWLLHNLNWLPDIHWLWILGLGGAGVFMPVARSHVIPESRTLHRRIPPQDRNSHG